MTKAADKNKIGSPNQEKPLVKEKKNSLEIAKEESEKVRAVLEEKLGKKVYNFCLPIAENDFCIGYLQDPDFAVKKMAMDMGMRSLTDAGELILETSIIREHSDPRIFHEDAGNLYPLIRMGAIMKAQTLVGYIQDAFKKK